MIARYSVEIDLLMSEIPAANEAVAIIYGRYWYRSGHIDSLVAHVEYTTCTEDVYIERFELKANGRIIYGNRAELEAQLKPLVIAHHVETYRGEYD